ncbi:MAG TPA: hypothetical protein VG291_11165 [Xanthobacteraceae bacterium]|nr:hypothetical protein [Xanthobacteraceae bacterium]
MPRLLILSLTALLLAGWAAPAALAQSKNGGPRIEWEVKNRFRLFRSEADFQRHVAADRGDGLLAAEDRLARESDGRGWARDTVERLCVDRAGKLLETCDRDGTLEDYLVPRDHRIGVALAGTIPANVGCDWSVDDGSGPPRETMARCEEEVKLRVAYGHTALASVDILLPDGTAQRVVADIAVRDILIAGLGDSIAAGEGNPDRPVRLSDEGFCFQRFLGTVRSEYYRPGRDGFNGNRSCSFSTGDESLTDAWARQSARWESGPCHRSLYSYQMRSALGLAVENSHIAVTFIPLGCSGARIDAGFLSSQRISECPSPGTNSACPGSSPAQIDELKELMARAHRRQPDRNIDLVLLTIGANDILFSGLIANVIIESTTDRILLGRGGAVATVADSQKILDNDLPGNFAKLRAALKPYVGGDLSRVLFVTYGNPVLTSGNTLCAGGRDGFDVHPAFSANSTRLHQVSDYLGEQFLPKIKALAVCEGSSCRDPASDSMTFVDAHQAAFANHGLCVRSSDDPEFDRACFSPNGDSFRTNPREAATDPMACGRPASEYRAYAPRARWIRTANDSYFTALTYPQGQSSLLQPSNIHDATWGIMSAVYGGAIHPTAEGHAAMADATLPAMRSVLGLQPLEPPVRSEPLPPLNVSAPPRVTR